MPTLIEDDAHRQVQSLAILESFDFGAYPVAMGIFEHCMQLEAFRKCRTASQPDAPMGEAHGAL